jgi:hypothetical protein
VSADRDGVCVDRELEDARMRVRRMRMSKKQMMTDEFLLLNALDNSQLNQCARHTAVIKDQL